MADRICEREGCKNSLEGHRRDARFCSDECRYLAWAAVHPRVSLDPASEPYNGFRNGSRRASRDGTGARLYLPSELVEELSSLVNAEPASPRLMAKVREAKKRIEGRRT